MYPSTTSASAWRSAAQISSASAPLSASAFSQRIEPHARLEAAQHLLAVEAGPRGEKNAVQLVFPDHLG